MKLSKSIQFNIDTKFDIGDPILIKYKYLNEEFNLNILSIDIKLGKVDGETYLDNLHIYLNLIDNTKLEISYTIFTRKFDSVIHLGTDNECNKYLTINGINSNEWVNENIKILISEN